MTMKLPPQRPLPDIVPLEGRAPAQVDVDHAAKQAAGEAPSTSVAHDARTITEPDLPPRSNDGGIAGPVAIGVGIGVFALLGGAAHPTSDPSILAPVLSALSGIGQLTIACVAAGVVYAKLKLAGAPLPTETTSNDRPQPPDAS